MTRVEQLNALTRFFLYLGILYILFANDPEYIYIPIIGIIIIIMVYYIQRADMRKQIEERFDSKDGENSTRKEVCVKPTKGNPFMNITMADLMDNRQRSTACVSTDPVIEDNINQNFNYNLFKNADDVFNRGYAQRQFYTMPSTTLPNDQTGFARWLYRLPPTCKENQSNCLKYEDLRFNRFNPNTDRLDRLNDNPTVLN
jgi:hypothetical protein